MSTEEIDMAIAEHLGWRCVEVYEWDLSTCPETRLPKQFHIQDGVAVNLPRYSTNLNAMREAEQCLFTRYHDAKAIFIDRLCRIMDPVSGYRKQEAIDIIDATADQHARAFVETIGKWRDA